MGFDIPLKDTLILAGGGKGGGGGMKEDPNTLRANSKFRVLDLLSEGETGGLYDGAKSIFLNETPLQNADGSWNFNGVKWAERFGLPDQTPIGGFEFATAEVPVGVEVKFGFPITRTVNASTVDSIIVKVGIPSLQFVDQKGSRIVGASVTFRLELIDGMSAVVYSQEHTISGKTSSEFQRGYYIKLPGADTYLLRMTRITEDAKTQDTANATVFAGYTEVNEDKFSYPDSALIGIEIDAEQFGDNNPNRAYLYKGIKCKVPVNYDPITHTYTGLWNGEFKLATTDDPAWILNDLLTNDRYGLGATIDQNAVDKLSLYTISRYCNELVPNGMGGFEPRFTFNAWIINQQDAHEALSIISSAFRGMIYWKTGSITAIQDSPEDPLIDVNETQVINGIFTYEKTAKRARSTVVYVSWTDPENFYKTAVEVVEDFEGVAQYGWQRRDVSLIGCHSRSLAIRMAKWILYTEQSESESVRYESYADHLRVAPGKIIKVVDSKRLGWRAGGRIAEVLSPTQLKLDGEYVFQPGAIYKVTVIKSDGSPEEIQIINPGVSTDTITLSVAPTLAQQQWWPWSILSNDPNYWAARRNGMLAGAADSTHVTLPEPFSFIAGQSYRIILDGPDNTKQTIPISNPATTTATVTLTAPATLAQGLNSPYTIVVNDAVKALYRVALVREITDDPGVITYEVNGLAHNPNKYAEIEQDIFFPDIPRYSKVKVAQVPAIDALTIKEVVEPSESAIRRHLDLSWGAPQEDGRDYPFLRAYEITYVRNDEGTLRKLETTDTQVRIEDLPEGQYTIRIRVLNTWGHYSRPFLAYAVLGNIPYVAPAVTGLELVQGASPTEFVGRDANFSWRKSAVNNNFDLGDEPNGADSGFLDAMFKDYRVSVYDMEGKLLRQDYTVDPVYSYTFDKNYADTNGVPVRKFLLVVQYRDKNNHIGLPSSLVVSNPVPELPNVEFDISFETVTLQYAQPSDPDFVGMRVWMSSTAGSTPDDNTLIHDGVGSPTFTSAVGVPKYIRYSVFDSFGKMGLNVSEEFTITTTGIGDTDLDETPPEDIIMPPVISIHTFISSDGSEISKLTGSWDDADGATGYDIDIDGTTLDWTEWSPVSSLKNLQVKVGDSYQIRVKGSSRTGIRSENWSPWSNVVNAGGDVTPPGPTTAGLVTAGPRAIVVQWTKPTDADFSHIRIVRNTSNTAAGATVVAPATSASSFADFSAVVGTTYYYFSYSVDRSGNETPVATLLGSAMARHISVGGGDVRSDDPVLVTNFGNAASFTGQTDWATLALPTTDLTRPGSNLLFNGGMKLKGQGFLGGSPVYDAVNGNYLVYSTSTQISERMPASAGQSYVLSAESTFFNSTNHFVYLVFYSAALAYLGEGSQAGYGQSFARDAGPPITAPAGTAFMQVWAFVSGIGSGGYIAVRKLKIEAGTRATPFNDDATDGARYRSGQNIDALQPGEAGANVTEGRVSASVVGQGLLATQSAAIWGTQISGRPTLTQGDSLTEDAACTDPSAWTVGGQTFVSVTDGKVGNTAIRGTGGTFYSARHVPIDPTKTYMLEGWYRRTGANNTAYGLVDLIAANGNRISGDGGFWLYGPAGVVIPAEWTYYSRVFGAGTGKPIPAAATQMAVGGLPNYNFASGATEVQGLRIVEVTTIGGNLRRRNGSLATEPQVITEQGVASSVIGQGPGATALANRVLNDRLEGNVRTIGQPDGGQFNGGNSSLPGQLQIVLPFGGTQAMMTFEVVIYDYLSGQTVRYIIGGYDYIIGPSWTNVSAQYIGPRGFARPVKFGHYLGKAYVWIGNVNNLWNYSVVSIKNLQIGFASQALAWESGWNISLNNTDISALVSATVAIPRAGDQVFGEGLLEQPGGAVATRNNFRTDLGIASSVVGQTLTATTPLAGGAGYATNALAFAALGAGVAYRNTTSNRLATTYNPETDINFKVTVSPGRRDLFVPDGSGNYTIGSFGLTPVNHTGTVSYAWEFLFGDPLFTISNPTSAITNVNAVGSQVGQYYQGMVGWSATDSGTGRTVNGVVYVTLRTESGN